MVNEIFYSIKPLIPRLVQISLRRLIIHYKRKKHAPIWPIDESAAKPPPNWKGWPNGKKFALILTHDVDTPKGLEKCGELIQLEESHGFRSSFNFVPRRYHIDPDFIEGIRKRGFEVAVHGLYHDGKLYRSRKTFSKRAQIINQYLRSWNAIGFRSPSMHHNLAWIHELEILYDASTFDTDPFEPQSDPIKSIFPLLITNNSSKNTYVELPYTLPQDFTLFVLMREKDIEIWKAKLDWIVEHGGMALLNTHPDYMDFAGRGDHQEEYPSLYYEEFLSFITGRYGGLYWHALPKDIARYCMENDAGHKINQ